MLSRLLRVNFHLVTCQKSRFGLAYTFLDSNEWILLSNNVIITFAQPSNNYYDVTDNGYISYI